jgi:3-dehydroquinate synthase
MRVLLTGAQGFIGRYVAGEWLASDPTVEIIGIGRSAVRAGFRHRVNWAGQKVAAPLPRALEEQIDSVHYRYESLDILDRPGLTRLLQEVRPQIVVHLASVLKDGHPTALMRCNVEGVLSLLEAIAGSGIPTPRVVLGSTGAVYGVTRTVPVSEDTPLRPTNLYAISKQTAEVSALELAKRHGIPVMVGRIFNPIGPGLDDRHFAAYLACEAALIGEGLKDPEIATGPLDTTRDFHDVRDAARALRLIAERGEPGTAYNIGRSVETPPRLLLEYALAAIGHTPESIEHHLRKGVSAGIPRQAANIDRLRALGFEPAYDLEQTMADHVRWYRERVAHCHAGSTECRLAVEVAPRWAYTVQVEPGLLATLPRQLQLRFPAARMVVLTDTRVHTLYGRDFVERLQGVGVQASVVVMPDGERSKALDQYQRIIEQMYAHGFERRSVLVCLGGGLVSDVGGFVAATYMRGVPYVNVPTTLLALHDAAIGGKVAVNMPWAKNFVGAFHHPSAVFCDPRVLATLDRRNLAGGVAESIKVALTGDADLFRLLEENSEAILQGEDAELLAQVVRRSIRQKVALLSPDPYEIDLRRALNLGHTLAHPLETVMEYADLLHGEAVGFGIALATQVALQRGVCAPAVAERIHRLLTAYGLPPEIPLDVQRAAFGRLAEIRMVRGGHLHFVMPTDIDTVQIVPDLELDELERAIVAMAERRPR